LVMAQGPRQRAERARRAQCLGFQFHQVSPCFCSHYVTLAQVCLWYIIFNYGLFFCLPLFFEI
jgi:hypothetical protein